MRLGILGGGQLGQMLALSAHPLGITTTVLDPADAPPSRFVAAHIQGEFNDFQALYKLVKASDAITYESENIPGETVQWLSKRLPTHPSAKALEVSQDRLIEKTFLRDAGIPVPEFAAIDSKQKLAEAIDRIGTPAILKTRRFGYDGKGQFVIPTKDKVEDAWDKLGGRPLILEEMVQFDRELSSIVVRGLDGSTRFYPLIENEHRDGMLHRSIAPAPNQREELFERACDHAVRLLDALDYVGVLTIEWFQDGPRLLANEIAPRVHNSGHWTIEGAVTSQFENHVRAILGLPLGDPSNRGRAEMLNLIGTHPPISELLRDPRASVHLYGKEPRPRRKLGHVTIIDVTQT